MPPQTKNHSFHMPTTNVSKTFGHIFCFSNTNVESATNVSCMHKSGNIRKGNISTTLLLQQLFIFVCVYSESLKLCNVVLTLQSVNKILWCDHSNESSPPALFHSVTYFFTILQIKIFYFFLNADFGSDLSLRSWDLAS